MVHKALAYWAVVAITRERGRALSSEIYDLVDASVAKRGHPRIADAQHLQVLIRLRNDGLVASTERNGREASWWATDTSWAGRADPRWPLLYSSGSSPYRIPHPGWGTKDRHEAEGPGEHFYSPGSDLDMVEDAEAIERSTVRTVFD
jgi:hypothetical protein